MGLYGGEGGSRRIAWGLGGAEVKSDINYRYQKVLENRKYSKVSEDFYLFPKNTSIREGSKKEEYETAPLTSSN